MSDTKYRYFIQQYKNRIFTYSLYMLKNRMDAEDVTQEVFIRIWKNIDGVNVLSAQTWIMKTAHNLCIDTLRKRGIEVKRETAIDECFEETYAGDNRENDPSIRYQLKVMNEAIKEAIKKLPENLKSVFVLYEIENLKYKEISKTLDIPLNSVKVYLMRARKKLQEELKKKEIHGAINYE
jgi:RNA polymerase sigma-70 factor (ECF subfamily)